jgi:hypothetical protein
VIDPRDLAVLPDDANDQFEHVITSYSTPPPPRILAQALVNLINTWLLTPLTPPDPPCAACASGMIDVTTPGKPWHSEHVAGPARADADDSDELARLRRIEERLLTRGAPPNTEELLDWLDRLLADLAVYRRDRQAAANADTTIRHLLDVHLTTCCKQCAAGATDTSVLGQTPHSRHTPPRTQDKATDA